MKRAAGIALLLAGWGCDPATEAQAETQAPAVAIKPTRATRIETAKITPSAARLELLLPGEVMGSRDAELAAPLGGYVERVLHHAGDEVKAGESIAWVDRSIYDAQLEQAQARLDQANSERDLTERAGASLTKARRDAAKYNALAAAAAHRLASVQAGRSRVRAPFSGVVAKVDVEQGEVLPPGGVVARLVELDPIKVTATVSDRDVVSLAPGMPVQITTDASSTALDGAVARIAPAADLKTRAFEIELSVKNAERRLLPGMIARVRLDVELDGEMIVIPQYVLVTRRKGNGVFVVEEDLARWRPLQLGRVVRDQVIVDSGLEPEAEIVVTGHRELVEGDAITVVRTGTCCTDGRVEFDEP